MGKKFATLDVLSDGRTLLGWALVGQKMNTKVSGVPYKDKGTRVDEFLQVLKKIWTDEIVEFIKANFTTYLPLK